MTFQISCILRLKPRLTLKFYSFYQLGTLPSTCNVSFIHVCFLCSILSKSGGSCLNFVTGESALTFFHLVAFILVKWLEIQQTKAQGYGGILWISRISYELSSFSCPHLFEVKTSVLVNNTTMLAVIGSGVID